MSTKELKLSISKIIDQINDPTVLEAYYEILKNVMKVHKSHIVNLSMVEKISKNQIYLLTGVKVPIGRTYKKILDERYLS